MPVDSVIRNSAGPGSENSIDRARLLCREALDICDELGLSPEIGARLQEAIAALEKTSIKRSR